VVSQSNFCRSAGASKVNLAVRLHGKGWNCEKWGVIPMCDVTYRRHGLKIEHGIRGKFAETEGVQAGSIRKRIEERWRPEDWPRRSLGCTHLAGFELTNSAVYQFPRARN
jgi:hypothetical protein